MTIRVTAAPTDDAVKSDGNEADHVYATDRAAHEYQTSLESRDEHTIKVI